MSDNEKRSADDGVESDEQGDDKLHQERLNLDDGGNRQRRISAVADRNRRRSSFEYEALAQLFYSCENPNKMLQRSEIMSNLSKRPNDPKRPSFDSVNRIINVKSVRLSLQPKRSASEYYALTGRVMVMLLPQMISKELVSIQCFLRYAVRGDVARMSAQQRLETARCIVSTIKRHFPKCLVAGYAINSFDVDKKAAAAVHGKNDAGTPGSKTPNYRRGSFLYRIDSDSDISHVPGRLADQQQHGEDLIVTPFAQVLATLRNVRENIVTLTTTAQSDASGDRPAAAAAQHGSSMATAASSSSSPRSLPPLPSSPTARRKDEPASSRQLAESTLMELDWCLEQLEAIQTHRSVSEMTSSKFRKMLTKELSQFSDSKSGDQLSRFIFSTFMGHDDDLEMSSDRPKQDAGQPTGGEDSAASSSSVMGKGKQHVLSSMSHISGLRKFKRSPTGSANEAVAAAINEPTLLACAAGSKVNPELEQCIDEIDRWGMDIFRLHRLCDSHSLTVVTFTIMKNRGLIKQFQVNTTRLLTYMLHLEDHYRQNSYHNCTHAADVTQTVHAMFSAPSVNSAFSELEKFSVIFAAAIHDVDHPGLTNQFLVNSGSELAIMYNDESVLEQHHLAVAFKLLQESDCDILTGMSQKQRQLFRRIVIDTVLATDMSKHMSLLADLKTMVETKKLSGPGLPKLEKYGDKIQVLQNMIHIADLSNPAKPLALYEQWVNRLLEEYWRQGDKEKELGLEISPMCDRSNVSRDKSQVGFIDYIIHPLIETWADLVYPDGQHMLDQLERNRNSFFMRLTEKDQEDFPPVD